MQRGSRTPVHSDRCAAQSARRPRGGRAAGESGCCAVASLPYSSAGDTVRQSRLLPVRVASVSCRALLPELWPDAAASLRYGDGKCGS